MLDVPDHAVPQSLSRRDGCSPLSTADTARKSQLYVYLVSTRLFIVENRIGMHAGDKVLTNGLDNLFGTLFILWK